jgi:hypothetical protein
LSRIYTITPHTRHESTMEDSGHIYQQSEQSERHYMAHSHASIRLRMKPATHDTRAHAQKALKSKPDCHAIQDFACTWNETATISHGERVATMDRVDKCMAVVTMPYHLCCGRRRIGYIQLKIAITYAYISTPAKRYPHKFV